jgi:hypothetical protein
VSCANRVALSIFHSNVIPRPLNSHLEIPKCHNTLGLYSLASFSALDNANIVGVFYRASN